ncbi:MAG: UDP-3-O-(3-hydroxymyristoyl)glucosamine N-acyltransferase [Bacteroidales bacterium]|nr:UDP-3-O-(3-hydroxymyristoyl)glucosamine N-acyltransferase [Bacteroidales bacterium]
MEYKAKELAEILGGRVDGNPETTVTDFARIEHGKPGTICFFANPKYEQYVYTSKADIIIVNESFQPQQPVQPTLIRVENAYTAIAALLDYVSAKKRSYRRHRGLRSRVRWSAKLGKKVYVGDFTYVGRRSVIGDCTKIYENVYIGDDVKIGKFCIIYPGVRIYSGMEIGNNVILQGNCVIGGDGFGFAPQPDGTYKKIEHTGKVIIEDDVEIGANTTVDKSQMEATVIHKGTKIDNLVQVAHNVEIGENTILCGQVGIAGSTKIGKSCVLAGQVGIAGHLEIADKTTLGAQAGIMSSIKEPGKTFMGSPALPHRTFLKAYSHFKKSAE